VKGKPLKTILCYGDSLTYGTMPHATATFRHAFEDRWPSVMAAALGEDKVRIIAEGLGGRTTVFDDFSGPTDRNGAHVLPTILGSHEPLDCVVIMLGTNDLKPHLCGNALGAAMGMKRLAEIVRTFPYRTMKVAPKVVLVAPPLCVATSHANLSPMFRGAVEESRDFAPHYARVARDAGCAFVDSANVARSSPVDGVHLEAEHSRAVGGLVAQTVAKLLEI